MTRSYRYGVDFTRCQATGMARSTAPIRYETRAPAAKSIAKSTRKRMTPVPRSLCQRQSATSAPVTRTWGRRPMEKSLTFSCFRASERAR